MPLTSLTLLERVRRPALQSDGSLRHDEAAWGRLVELYTPLLFQWSVRTGLDETEAEDLVQEVFTVVLNKLPDFERERDGSFRTWLRVVTLNNCRERFRRKQLPGLGANVEPLSAVADPLVLSEFWEHEYRTQLVQQALSVMQTEFSDPVWQACWQHVVENRPAADVGADLGITANAVRVYSSRVLARLRLELRGLLED